MLTFLQNNYYKKYEKNERSTNLFITFLFLIFFLFFINNTTSPDARYILLVNTFLLIIWYGLTLVIN